MRRVSERLGGPGEGLPICRMSHANNHLRRRHTNLCRSGHHPREKSVSS